MNPQNVSNPQQRGDTGVDVAGLDVLERLAAHAGGEEHALLGAVLPEPFDADAVTDGASAVDQPGVVIGEVGHSSETRRQMIFSQPGNPRIFGSRLGRRAAGHFESVARTQR
jgi:hypothetical protein